VLGINDRSSLAWLQIWRHPSPEINRVDVGKVIPAAIEIGRRRHA
jgi:hypothetical protein